MKKFSNSAKDKFLINLPTTSIESDNQNISAKCKFNFSYFTVQTAGQDFENWDHDKLHRLLGSLRDFSRESLAHWRMEPCKSGTVLTIYGNFPPKAKTDFEHPPHVPHEAQWGRFRLASAVRLVGFTIPSEFCQYNQKSTNMACDSNTFYVVFLDANHRFWKSEKK